jgi:hypothetical protein
MVLVAEFTEEEEENIFEEQMFKQKDKIVPYKFKI